MNFKQDVFSEPMDVVGVAEKVAEVIQVPLEEVCRQTTLNARNFFRLDEWEESLHHKF
jgi:Tat protein secretion system quality control protein TatD with DNase activity